MTPSVLRRGTRAPGALDTGRRDRTSTVLLVAGYALAVGAGAKLWPVWQQRQVRRFVVFEAGTVLVTTGLLLRGKPLPAAANGATAAALGLAWVARDRCSG
ncbi:MAG: hypothetical protein ACLGI2_13485 [Acidimicrobiia bacterium]